MMSQLVYPGKANPYSLGTLKDQLLSACMACKCGVGGYNSGNLCCRLYG